jgi:tRNA pseudouridine38-40 synthase
VGTLLDAQREADPAATLARVLAGGNRRFAGATAPAAGLYLWRVEYPPIFGIPPREPKLLLPATDAADDGALPPPG